MLGTLLEKIGLRRRKPKSKKPHTKIKHPFDAVSLETRGFKDHKDTFYTLRFNKSARMKLVSRGVKTLAPFMAAEGVIKLAPNVGDGKYEKAANFNKPTSIGVTAFFRDHGLGKKVCGHYPVTISKRGRVTINLKRKVA